MLRHSYQISALDIEVENVPVVYSELEKELMQHFTSTEEGLVQLSRLMPLP
jgi:hypothetical protein